MAGHRFPAKVILRRDEAIELLGALTDATEVVSSTEMIGLALELQRQVERLTDRLAGHWPETGHGRER
ncbi:MAG TPA: hypothetical protein VGB14_13890 [Acidimicrobiales bacterium]